MESSVRWTNESVGKLAGSDDPIEVIVRKARETILAARDKGWVGPPFSQVKLANLLDLVVEADSSVTDAQTVSRDDKLVIRYNPTQVRERVRFSIAHEIAHTFFPDVKDAVRNRGGDRAVPDDWQLELLCNIAAAELTMPLGSLATDAEIPALEELLQDRRKYDVSAEAYLIRIAKTASTTPVMMFSASPHIVGDQTTYRIDYSIPSPAWDGPRAVHATIPTTSVLSHCSSIGTTARGKETWPGLGSTVVEAVGIPGYPGARLPRVVGLLRATTAQRKVPYELLQGNILDGRSGSKRIVCQLVNDQARVWGGGVAKASAGKWPAAQADYTRWLERIPRPARLGQVHFWEGEDVVLASLIAQHGLRSTSGPMIRYSALGACLSHVASVAIETKLPVYLPRLGTGVAGASWDIVEQLVLEELSDKGIPVTVVDLPPKRLQGELQV